MGLFVSAAEASSFRGDPSTFSAGKHAPKYNRQRFTNEDKNRLLARLCPIEPCTDRVEEGIDVGRPEMIGALQLPYLQFVCPAAATPELVTPGVVLGLRRELVARAVEEENIGPRIGDEVPEGGGVRSVVE